MQLLRSSTLLMLFSATAWALVPFFFALGAETGPNVFLYTAVVNALGSCLSAGLYIARSRRRRDWHHLAALRAYVRSSAGRKAILLDGGGIAVSNAAFVYALGFESDAAVTLIVESWPLLAAFLLTGVISRFQGLSVGQVFWSLVALAGFYVLVVGQGQPLMTGLTFTTLIAAVFSALMQAIAVSAHQRALQDLSEDLDKAKNFLLQCVRMIIASGASLLLAVLFGPVSMAQVSIVPAAGVALAIVGSALLYAMSLQAATSSVPTLMWFITPVISIALLASAGLADLTSNVLVGATLIVSANIFLQEKLEAPINLIALVIPSVAVGTVILYTDGAAVDGYFDYVQIVAAFYGILQGFLLSRLWDRRSRIGILEEQWVLQGHSQEMICGHITYAQVAHDSGLARDAAELSVLRAELRSYSEAVLLTVLGIAASIVVISGRANTLVGDVLAFLVPVAIVYLLTISWSLTRVTRRRESLMLTPQGVAEAAMSYVLVVLIFGAMLLAIGMNV